MERHFCRFNLCSRKGILSYLFKELAKDADFEWVFIDGSIVRAHQHSTGAATSNSECIGKSRGGNSTKIHLAVDSNGFPVYFELPEGQRNDIIHAQSLVEHVEDASTVITDKGYDSDSLRDFIESKSGKSVIPKRRYNKEQQKDVDWCLYKYRHLVKNAFGRIKHFRSISTRYGKLARNYASMVSLAFVLM